MDPLNIPKNLINNFNQIFQGRTAGMGWLTGFKPDGKKDARSKEGVSIDWEKHLKGLLTQGISPVNKSEGGVRWFNLDIDTKIKEEEILPELWKIDHELLPFKSISGKWHVYKFYDDWTEIEQAKKHKEDLIKKLKKFKWTIDLEHSLPANVSDQYWVFLPYSMPIQKCYTPYGTALTLKQFIYRHKYRKHPLIAACVGAAEGKRHKALFNVALYEKHNKLGVDLFELNQMFDPPVDEKEIYHQIKSADKYDQDHLNRNLNNYIDAISEIEHFAKNKKEANGSWDKSAWRHGLSATELDKIEIKPIDWIVEDLISPGLIVIAGKSKIGKSWLAMQLSNAVENALSFLGKKTTTGAILHYSLEDGKIRTKNRWKQMGINPKKINYQFRDRKIKIPPLTKGLEQEIEDWIENTPDAKLVIIDPYQKVKIPVGGKKMNAYEVDNLNLQDLQTLAIKHNIAIVLIHHLNKSDKEDIFDTITGSAGIQSNADSMIVISVNRTIANNPILYCIPKDAEQTSMEIQLNPNCTWENVGRPGEARVTELQKTILDFLKDDKERSSMEIVGHVTNKLPEVKDGHVRKEISRLVDKSHITKLKRGLYRKVPF